MGFTQIRTAETTTIAVCAGSELDLERITSVIRAAGSYAIAPVCWPDAAAMSTARQLAHAYILHATEETSSLVELLASRPEQAPLIVIGSDPASAARPTIWVPTLPAPSFVGRMLEQLLGESGASVSSPAWRRKSDMIVGTSEPIRHLLHTLDQLAPAHTPVLISGESGVGKELVARALHFASPRASAPFVAINCAAIPESLIEAELFGYQRGAFTGAVAAHAGAFEAADQGTLFLDEIGEMPLAMQAKLLRVLETGEVTRIGSTVASHVEVRLVSATNRKLEDEVQAGRFREDLYYRVQVYPIEVPPLWQRLEDIPLLVTHQLSAIAQRDQRSPHRLTAAALEKLVTYHWPGNVRELVNLLERAALLADGNVIDIDHIILTPATTTEPPTDQVLLPYREAKARFELDYYTQLLRIAGGNISLAAKLGQKTRKEVYDALKRHGLDASSYRVLGQG
jgi:DNA-binding NtrC family response regulator